MRKNPLLYSDHDDIEEPLEYEAPKSERSWLFYLIIIANFLLVLFVLGLIWFLFLKSPDFQIKELTERFFGNGKEPPQELVDTKPAPTTSINIQVNTPETTNKQKQEEVQQARLKKMREQEALDEAERQRSEKIRTELEAESVKAEKAKIAIDEKTSKPDDAADTSDPITDEATQIESPVEPEIKTETIPEQETKAPEATVQEEATPNNKSGIIPNAASEALAPPTGTVNTQVDQIMETLRQQQREKEKEAAENPLNDSRAPTENKKKNSLSADSDTKINHLLIEKQLEALIETEQLKSEADKLLQQAEELDKKIRINQKVSILQANAV